jgi:outer membrane protein assembly factor BamB
MNRLKSIVFLTAGVLLAGQLAAGADWNVYRHDNHRTSVTDDKVDAAKLGLLWVVRSANPPLRAWDGAAAIDAYHGVRNLGDMRNYDAAFYAVASGGCVYFGSSADDTVRCIDAASGKEKWRFTTDGPVRVAPAVHDARVYFGSDDGWVYCLSAADGKVVWKFSPQPARRRILSNGRAIAVQPCRTGVTIDGGTAYFAFSMLPWERSYLCAVDAATGKITGKEHYVRIYEETLSLEAPAALSGDAVFMPQGRSAMMRFSRSDGKDLGGVGGGGSFVSLNGGEVMHGPGTRGQALAGIGGAYDVVAAGGVKYAVGDRNVVCMAGKAVKWNVPLAGSRAIILAGGTVFAGGDRRVAAFARDDGKELWAAPVEGVVYGLAAADGRLIASTDEGHVYCFGPGGKAAPEVAGEKGRPMGAVDANPLDLSAGLHVQFTDPDRAVVYWETSEPSPTVIEYGRGQSFWKIEKAEKTTSHQAALTGLKRGEGYTYLIRAAAAGQMRSTRPGVIDPFFNYTTAQVAGDAKPYADDQATQACAAAAEAILKTAKVHDGICVVLGSGDGRLAWEIAKRSRLHVIGFDTDAAAVDAGRAALIAAGAYGARVSLHHAAGADDVLLVGDCANLLVSQRALTGQPTGYSGGEMQRLVKPGCVAILDGKAVAFTKPLPPGAGVWSHQYGSGANASFGGEELAGATSTSQLAVQWVGKPGPRYQPDREPRKPSPLAAGGRLYAQGLRRIIAMDAHNGTILWSLEIPNLIRMNMPDDCGNWAADDTHLWAVVQDKCWQIDGATGQVVKKHRVAAEGNFHWGYIGREGKVLIGSTINPGSTFTGYTGAGAWYDDASSRKVCSSGLFALDPAGGKTLWTYRKGTIINPTITLTPSRVYFIESREGDLWRNQMLVALDAATGKVAWETPFKGPGPSIVYFLAHSADKLVLLANAGYTYHVYGFSDADGKEIWHQTANGRGNHGAHMTHPAVVNGVVYARPKLFDLSTGKELGDMPSGGCGTYSCSAHGVFFRANHTTMWSYDAKESSNYYRLRPDCWLSVISGCGMLLSPEASGGCICGGWIETSLGFKPATDLPVFKTTGLQFTGELDVAIREPLTGGDVHYTTDGTDPTPSSPKGDKPIRIGKSTEIRACVVRAGKAGKVVSRWFERIETKVATAMCVNFQPPGAVPEGCVGDFGEPFGERPNGYAYGWSSPMKDAVRDRRRGPDRKLATQVFFMPGVKWSIAVENGTYTVTVSVGDAAYAMPDGTIYVNGVELCKGISLGQESFKSFTKDVTVTDGRLTMWSHQKAAPADRTRVNFIEFKKK